MTAKSKAPAADAHRRDIEIRAYLIWEREGKPHGRAHEHWARAEAEVLGAATKKAVPRKRTPAKSAAAKTATTTKKKA